MNPSLSCLHPNPGWEADDSSAEVPPGPRPTMPDSRQDQRSETCSTGAMVGKHCILELYGCDVARLDDEVFLRATLSIAARRAGATLLNLITHRFEPQGVTGLALLAESHISIHTWPESGYAAVDVFTCGDHTMPERACSLLARELGASRRKLTSLRREAPADVAGSDRAPAGTVLTAA